MERELFSIEPSGNSWVIYDGTHLAGQPDPTAVLALEHASGLAYQRHVSTGHPTGVKVRFHCGDTMMFTTHG